MRSSDTTLRSRSAGDRTARTNQNSRCTWKTCCVVALAVLFMQKMMFTSPNPSHVSSTPKTILANFKVAFVGNYEMGKSRKPVVSYFAHASPIQHRMLQTPTFSPVPSISMHPSLQPSGQPSSDPSARPSGDPSAVPSLIPSTSPSADPSALPSMTPSTSPSAEPSSNPTDKPSASPSMFPTISASPSSSPTLNPSMSSSPSASPTSTPSTSPSDQPTSDPSSSPSASPSIAPSLFPSSQPTESPSASPSVNPSHQPSESPSSQPTSSPSSSPSANPTATPSFMPTTTPSSDPSASPSNSPSSSPSMDPTSTPSFLPSTTPSSTPSALPTSSPSSSPSGEPSVTPSLMPSVSPSDFPSSAPTSNPSSSPSAEPTSMPSLMPSVSPTASPSAQPSSNPSEQPSPSPSGQPTSNPSSFPSVSPSWVPSRSPSSQPTADPSASPSTQPTTQPSVPPSAHPTSEPSSSPSAKPSATPSIQPTDIPSISTSPTSKPSVSPTAIVPSTSPSGSPSMMPSSSPSNNPTNPPTNILKETAVLDFMLPIDTLLDSDSIATFEETLEDFLNEEMITNSEGSKIKYFNVTVVSQTLVAADEELSDEEVSNAEPEPVRRRSLEEMSLLLNVEIDAIVSPAAADTDDDAFAILEIDFQKEATKVVTQDSARFFGELFATDAFKELDPKKQSQDTNSPSISPTTKSNTAAIASSTAGGVLLGSIVLLFFVSRHRRGGESDYIAQKNVETPTSDIGSPPLDYAIYDDDDVISSLDDDEVIKDADRDSKVEICDDAADKWSLDDALAETFPLQRCGGLDLPLSQLTDSDEEDNDEWKDTVMPMDENACESEKSPSSRVLESFEERHPVDNEIVAESATAQSGSKPKSFMKSVLNLSCFTDNTFKEQEEEDAANVRRSSFASNSRLYEVRAPPGPLGIIVDNSPSGGTVIAEVKATSPLKHMVNVGDKIVMLDDVDTSKKSADALGQWIRKKPYVEEQVLILMAKEECDKDTGDDMSELSV